jgi:hypothetical protein
MSVKISYQQSPAIFIAMADAAPAVPDIPPLFGVNEQ